MMENLFLTVVTISLTTSVLILALLLLGSLINKRYVAKWKYGIWIVIALRLLVPVNYRLPDAQIQVTIPAEVGSLSMADIFEAAPPDLTQPIEPQMQQQLPTVSQPVATLHSDLDSQTEPRNSFTLLQVLCLLWAAGAICLLAWQLTIYGCYKRGILKKGNAAESAVILGQLRSLILEMGIRKQVTLLIYKNAHSPMIIGMWKPVLVLPDENYTPDESYYILKHELVHLKRRDILVKFLLILARDIHWFNPIVYLMQREAVVDMELACDEAVVRGGSLDQREAYTETLMSNLHRQRSKGPLLSTQFSASKRVMKKRFRNILTRTNKRNGIIAFAIILVMTVTVGTVVGYAMEEPVPENSEDEEMSNGIIPDGNTEDENSAVQGLDKGDDITENAPEVEIQQGREASTMLTVMKEGIAEEIPASLYVGEGYSLYLTDGWVNFVSDSWYLEANESIRFWISNFEGLDLGQAERILTNQGYEVSNGESTREGTSELWKWEDDTWYYVMCCEAGNDVWRLNAVYSPFEAIEGAGQELRAMFNTFTVQEGYDVGSHTEKAVMPEGEHPKLYEVTYTDNTSRAWAVHEPEYTGSYVYDEITISNITDISFDFTVTRRDFETDETEIIIPLNTAYFNDDMISATCTGEDYTLIFDFSDSSNPLPVVLFIKLWGVDSLEGISFYNNSIPGYESD